MHNPWPHIQEILQKTVNPGLFKVWIKPLQARSDGDAIELVAPNEFVAQWVRDRLLTDIKQAAVAVCGNAPSISVRAASTSGPPPQPAPLAARRDSTGSGEGASYQAGLPMGNMGNLGALGARSQKNGEARTDTLRWRYSFDDFVVGPSNELAHAAAKSLISDTLHAERLFLSSTTGLGKTHLLQAVGKALCEQCNKSRPKVCYISAEEFGRHWLMACRAGEFDRFKARYRDNVDILLMEDVHFFQGKEKLQNELLGTLDCLQEHGAKVVFSSSFLPRELKSLDGLLASRLGSGLLAVIERPDFETRCRILRRKAGVFQVGLPDNVVDFMAESISSDVRQLESCLQSLVLKARLLNRQICMEMAQQVVDNYAASEPFLTMEGIEKQICRCFGLTPEQVGSKSRRREIVLARNTAFFLARKYTELSLKDIGERFNRRHTTVLKGITNVEREMTLQTPLGRQLTNTVDMIKKQSLRRE